MTEIRPLLENPEEPDEKTSLIDTQNSLIDTQNSIMETLYYYSSLNANELPICLNGQPFIKPDGSVLRMGDFPFVLPMLEKEFSPLLARLETLSPSDAFVDQLIRIINMSDSEVMEYAALVDVDVDVDTDADADVKKFDAKSINKVQCYKMVYLYLVHIIEVTIWGPFIIQQCKEVIQIHQLHSIKQTGRGTRNNKYQRKQNSRQAKKINKSKFKPRRKQKFKTNFTRRQRGGINYSGIGLNLIVFGFLLWVLRNFAFEKLEFSNNSFSGVVNKTRIGHCMDALFTDWKTYIVPMCKNIAEKHTLKSTIFAYNLTAPVFVPNATVFVPQNTSLNDLERFIKKFRIKKKGTRQSYDNNWNGFNF